VSGAPFRSWRGIRMTTRGQHSMGNSRHAKSLAEAGGWIGGGGKLAGGLTGRRVRRHLSGGRNGDSDTDVPIEVILAAGRAISLTGVFIAKAGELVAAANTVAIAGLRSSLDRDEWHRFSLRCWRKHGMERNNAQGARSQNSQERFELEQQLAADWAALRDGQLGTSPIFLKCVRRKGEPRFSRSSIQ
jgi:hypothetical protein